MDGLQRHKVLFVDDDPAILRSIQRELRSYSDRWELVFADSGQRALERLQAEPFDVLITDMLMPGIDGAALLHQVKEKWPTTIRIVLSSHSEFEHAVRSVPFAHQRLGKPWQKAVLVATLERACSLRRLVANDNVRIKLSHVGALPSAPDAYVRLAVALDDPQATFTSLATVIEEDMAMSAKVLQLANSAFVASRHDVTTVGDAVRIVGLEAIRRYVLSPFLNVFDVFAGASGEQRSQFDHLTEHALLTAHLARSLSRGNANTAFLAGIIHDVGALFLVAQMPEMAERIRHEALEKDCSVADIEHRRLGATHADIGGYLLGLWGVPHALTDAVARHHEHGAGQPGDELNTTLRIADWLAYEHAARSAKNLDDARLLVLPFDEDLLEATDVMRQLPRYLLLARECADRLGRAQPPRTLPAAPQADGS
jgi:HD-like signal output (HDOD) protein